jgi:hypothetical protein
MSARVLLIDSFGYGDNLADHEKLAKKAVLRIRIRDTVPF